MIGVVGPRDSVAQVSAVAGQLDVDVPLVTRVYGSPAEVVDLVRELDEVCAVILFTGRVPFALAGAALRTRSHLEYIPHEGTDLLRVVARLLMRPDVQEDGVRVSLDGIETALAEEIFEDIGLGADSVRTIPMVLQDTGVGYSARDVAAQHQELHSTGEVDVCLTCLDSVYRLLRRRGVPVERITHTRMVVRAALERCLLVTSLGRASAAQLAVCLVAPAATAPDDDSHRSLAEALARDVALRMNAELVADPDGAKLVTTRGAVERWLAVGPAGKLRETEFARAVDFGYGWGETVVLAERNARRALAHAQREGRPYAVRPDGVAQPVDPAAAPSYRSRVTEPDVLRTSREVGLSPASLQRLVHVLRRIDSLAVTSAGLASSYGVSDRSARRLLAKLVAGGYAESVGVEQGAGAGRPQAVYRVHLDRLLTADTG